MSIASHRRLWWLISAALLLVLALSLVRTGLASGAPRRPPTPADLPVAIEGLARHTPQTSCDPTTKPGTLKLARLLTSTYPATRYGTVRACGSMPSSEHQEGRAVDWMASVRSPERRAEVQAVLGLARATSDDAELSELVLVLERDLWVVMAELATKPANRAKLKPGTSLVTVEMVERLICWWRLCFWRHNVSRAYCRACKNWRS